MRLTNLTRLNNVIYTNLVLFPHSFLQGVIEEGGGDYVESIYQYIRRKKQIIAFQANIKNTDKFELFPVALYMLEIFSMFILLYVFIPNIFFNNFVNLRKTIHLYIM